MQARMMWKPSVNAIWLRAGSSSEEAARVVRTVLTRGAGPCYVRSLTVIEKLAS